MDLPPHPPAMVFVGLYRGHCLLILLDLKNPRDAIKGVSLVDAETKELWAHSTHGR